MMSDDEEYDDELPPISVNSSTRESGAMHMPSAEELASQRAREAECERELQLLRAGDVEPVLHTADSSGSEGEAVLASAVAKLQMIGVVRARPPPLSELLPPLLARLPQADALTDPAVHVPSSLLDAICEASLAGKLPEGAAALAAAAMCAGAVAGGSRASRRCSRRALHKLLTEPPLCDPTNEDSLTLKAAILDGITDAQTRLELADALAPALAAPLAALLHRRLLAAALAELLNCDPEPAEAARPRPRTRAWRPTDSRCWWAPPSCSCCSASDRRVKRYYCYYLNCDNVTLFKLIFFIFIVINVLQNAVLLI